MGANKRRQSCVHHGHAGCYSFGSILSTTLPLKHKVFYIMIAQNRLVPNNMKGPKHQGGLKDTLLITD